MSKVKRGDQSPGSGKVTYSVMLNVVAQGTKKMPPEEQDAHVQNEPDNLEVILRDADNSDNILFQDSLAWIEFKPNDQGQSSIGFKAHETGQSFPPSSE